MSINYLWIYHTHMFKTDNIASISVREKCWRFRYISICLYWHVETSFILQPPKYLLLFFNRFRYINDNVTKDRCSIPMDTTVRLGLLKFSLRATIDHHGLSIHSGHYTASINSCEKNSFATNTQLRSLELLTAKTPLLHYMNWLTHDFWTPTGG